MISLQYLTSKWKSIALRYRKLATGYPRIPRHCFATLQRETKFATCIPFGYLDCKIFIDGGNDNKKKKNENWKGKRKRKKGKKKKKYGWKNPYRGLGSREIRRLTRPVLSVNHLIEQNLSSRGQRCAGTGKLRIPRWVLLDGFLSETRKFLALNFS